jgi:hypothetical protein
MDFKGYINESSLNTLYQSAVDAFPNTRKRQFAVGEIEIENVRAVPYLGMRTLFVQSGARNQDRHYSPVILFRDVNYNENGEIIIEYQGDEYRFDRLSLNNNDVLIRCNCPDFYWRFTHYNHLDHSLYGRDRAFYQNQGGPPANPQEMPGMCKHLLALIRDLDLF